ncbi:hypothetical protein FA95DRAFT_1578952, partial [Auriscalpium vulgare]
TTASRRRRVRLSRTLLQPGTVAAPPAVPIPVSATVVPVANTNIAATTTVVTAANADIPATAADIPATAANIPATAANIPVTAANIPAAIPAVLEPATAVPATAVPTTAVHVPASGDASANTVTHGPIPLSIIPIPQAASDMPPPSDLTMSAGLYVPPAHSPMEFVGPGGVALTGPGPEVATLPQKRGYDFGFGTFDTDNPVYKTPRLTEAQWSGTAYANMDIEAPALGLPEEFATASVEGGIWGGPLTDLLMDGLGNMNNL